MLSPKGQNEGVYINYEKNDKNVIKQYFLLVYVSWMFK